MATNSFKQKVYQELSRVTSAIANAKRLELLDILSQRDYSVEELSNEIDMSIASTSQHLQVLKKAKLVETTRKGNFIMYRITNDNALQLLTAVKAFGFQKIAEIELLMQDFKSDKSRLDSLNIDEFLKRSKNEEFILLDVRPEAEYNSGHIPNAITIPLEQLKERIKELPMNKTIVAYCRGPLCVMASDAVKILTAKKLTAVCMEDGFIEWKMRQHEFKK